MKAGTVEERKFWKLNQLIAGVDEAGRGALAGPVVAAAVILPKSFKNRSGIGDSKTLSAEKRDVLFKKILKSSLCYGVGIVPNEEIDSINILQATMLAMKAAIDALEIVPQHLLIDGNYYRDQTIPFTTIIEGDARCVSIAAASIIAKVTRDRWMETHAEENFPHYGFKTHKGYGTKFHREKILQFGSCTLHRSTFLKKILPVENHFTEIPEAEVLKLF
ncbi:MAG: ribonuclease HII [Bacteroidota bacterium]